MPRWLGFAVFFAIAIAILVGVHTYFWARLVRDPAWPQPWRALLTLLLVLLAAALPVAFVLGRYSTGGLGKALVWTAYVWMGHLWLLLVVLVGLDLLRLGGRLLERLAPAAPWVESVGRVLGPRWLAGGSLLLVLALGAHALAQGLSFPEVRRVRVELARLPAALSGTRIVQISDVHVGPTRGRAFVEELVARTNALEPDLVAITGDLVDGGVGHLNHSMEPLRELRARHGVYFVTGNHEYYAGVEEWTEALTALGLRVLDSERVRIGEGEASFELAGIPDPTATRMGLPPPDLERALAGLDASREVVLLAHQPKAIAEASRLGVGLQLSGHTHGGQLWPWGYLVGLTQPYVSGLVRHAGTALYVSNGTGYWGPPMRLGAPSELTLLELVRE